MADQANRASELRILGLWRKAMTGTRQRARGRHVGSLVARDAGGVHPALSTKGRLGGLCASHLPEDAIYTPGVPHPLSSLTGDPIIPAP